MLKRTFLVLSLQKILRMVSPIFELTNCTLFYSSFIYMFVKSEVSAEDVEVVVKTGEEGETDPLTQNQRVVTFLFRIRRQLLSLSKTICSYNFNQHHTYPEKIGYGHACMLNSHLSCKSVSFHFHSFISIKYTKRCRKLES